MNDQLLLDALLKAISKHVVSNGAFSNKLWCILTALRGPDNEEYQAKAAITAVIRYKLFANDLRERNYNIDPPKVALDSGDGFLYMAFPLGFGIRPDCQEAVEIRKSLVTGNGESQSHFLYHARGAFHALGLKWDEVNE